MKIIIWFIVECVRWRKHENEHRKTATDITE